MFVGIVLTMILKKTGASEAAVAIATQAVGFGAIGAIVGAVRTLLARTSKPENYGAAEVTVSGEELVIETNRYVRRVARNKIDSGWLDASGNAVIELKDGTQLSIAGDREKS